MAGFAKFFPERTTDFSELSDEELRGLVKEAIDEAGATSMAEIGRVMGVLMPKIQGKADGKEANQIVREMLQAG